MAIIGKKKKKDTLKVLKSSTNYWCLKFRIQLCILHTMQREQVPIFELEFHKDAGGIMLLHFWVFCFLTCNRQSDSARIESKSSCGSKQAEQVWVSDSGADAGALFALSLDREMSPQGCPARSFGEGCSLLPPAIEINGIIIIHVTYSYFY